MMLSWDVHCKCTVWKVWILSYLTLNLVRFNTVVINYERVNGLDLDRDLHVFMINFDVTTVFSALIMFVCRRKEETFEAAQEEGKWFRWREFQIWVSANFKFCSLLILEVFGFVSFWIWNHHAMNGNQNTTILAASVCGGGGGGIVCHLLFNSRIVLYQDTFEHC